MNIMKCYLFFCLFCFVIYQGEARNDSLAKSYDPLDFRFQLQCRPLKSHPYLIDTIFPPFQFYCMELYLVQLDDSPTHDPKSFLLSILLLIDHYSHYSFHCNIGERRDVFDEIASKFLFFVWLVFVFCLYLFCFCFGSSYKNITHTHFRLSFIFNASAS